MTGCSENVGPLYQTEKGGVDDMLVFITGEIRSNFRVDRPPAGTTFQRVQAIVGKGRLATGEKVAPGINLPLRTPGREGGEVPLRGKKIRMQEGASSTTRSSSSKDPRPTKKTRKELPAERGM